MKFIVIFIVSILPIFQVALYASDTFIEATTQETTTSTTSSGEHPRYSKPVFPRHEKNHSLKLFLAKIKTGFLANKEDGEFLRNLPLKMTWNEFVSLLQQTVKNHAKKHLLEVISSDSLEKIKTHYSLQPTCPKLKFQEPEAPLKTNGFEKDTSLAIFRTAQNIRKLSSPDGLTIFVGRSPIWIARAYQILLEKVPPHSPAVHVHFSGKPDSMDYCSRDFNYLLTNLVTPDRLAFYRRYLKEIGIFPGMTHKKIYLVDYLEEGEGIYQFARILKEWFEEEGLTLPDLYIFDMNRSSLTEDKKEGRYKNQSATEDGEEEDFEIQYHCVNGEADGMDDFDFLMKNEAFGVYFPAFKWNNEHQPEVTNYIQDQETVSKMNSDLLDFYDRYVAKFPEILESGEKSFDEIEEEIDSKDDEESLVADSLDFPIIDLPQEVIDFVLSDKPIRDFFTPTNPMVIATSNHNLRVAENSTAEDASLSSCRKPPRKKQKNK